MMEAQKPNARTAWALPASGARFITKDGSYNKVYYYTLLIALAFCWFPSKLVGYLAPGVAIAWFLLGTRSHVALRNLLVGMLVWSVALLTSWLLTPNFALSSALLTLLTYGSFFFLITVPTRSIGGEKLLAAMAAVARWVVLFQGTWGIVQGLASAARSGTFDGTTGDAVAGTIRPFAVSPDLSNPIFAINMAFLLIMLLPSVVNEGKGRFAFAIGLLSLILASVIHVLLFVGAALVVAFIISYPTFFFRKRGLLLVFALLAAGILATTVLSRNFGTVKNYVQYTLEGRTPRARVTIRAVTDMPQSYPWMPIIGLGPGQFSSRAALIGTGQYFGTPANPRSLPLLPGAMSEPFERYLWDQWISLFFDRFGNYVHSMDNTSSTVQPFFSWLSVYSEFGLVGTVAVLILVAGLILRVRMTKLTKRVRLIAVSFVAGVLFLFVLGAQENYWEVPQAILIGLIFLKAQYANIVYYPSAELVT